VKPVSQLSRRFRVVFDDDKTVPNAGLAIPLRLADRLGFSDAINRRVRGRNQQRRRNSGDKALAIVAMLAAGGEFISDVDVFAAGSTLHRLGYRWFSQSRLGEWLRSLDDNDIGGFADALTEITDTAWTAGLGPDLDAVSTADPLVMDLDSTFTETYGAHKDGTGRRNYQGMHGYYPLLAVEASTGEMIAAQLRKGNATMNGVADFTVEALARLRRLSGPDTPCCCGEIPGSTCGTSSTTAATTTSVSRSRCVNMPRSETSSPASQVTSGRLWNAQIRSTSILLKCRSRSKDAGTRPLLADPSPVASS
jgi:hypothetical protein